MDTPILTLTLRSKRDIVLARRHARHIAGLLGCSPRLQAWVSAAVFEIACNAYRDADRTRLRFQVVDGALQVFPVNLPEHARRAAGQGMTRLDFPLPRGAERLTTHDVAWALKQVTRIAPLNLFEEMRKQNLELLHVLQDLEQLLGRAGRVDEPGRQPAAA